MTTYVDTSVLVAALVEDDPAHEASLRVLRGKGLVTWNHSLAEVYSLLTGGRLGVRVAPLLAGTLVREALLPRLELLKIPGRQFADAIREATEAGARGGAVFDFLHLYAARRAGVKVFRTLNVRNVAAFAMDGDPAIEPPPA